MKKEKINPTKSKYPTTGTPDEKKLKKELLELSLNPSKENYKRRQDIINILWINKQ